MNGTNNLQPATLDDCNLVLAQYPDLTAANARRAREGLPPEVCYPPIPITDPDVRGEISTARQFIRKVGRRRKTINRKLGTSYGLKHQAERHMGVYISNGAFIAAAYLEGYAMKREGPNACVSLRFTPEYRQILTKR